MKCFTPDFRFKDDGIDFSESVGLTQTQFAEQADINYQIARLVRGDTSVLKSTGLYYDISDIPADMQSALQMQINAREIWNADCNEEVRCRFGRPENLIDFLADSNNKEEAIKLGFIAASEKPVEKPVTAVAASVAKSDAHA